MKYLEPTDDEWFEVTRHHRIACCDCGLVHDFEFKAENGKLYAKAKRNNRATAGVRRGLKKQGLLEVG